MSIAVRSITFDCEDPYRLAQWWCKVFSVEPSPTDFPGDPVALCTLGEDRARLLFERVPEAKATKNRVHIDIQAGERREEEIARLVALGAAFLADHRDEGTGWVVLADPEGNEFCLETGAPGS
ncbi:MAG: VOC family protein [Acidimicrobiales bacterium]